VALLADFPSGMNITARSQGERDERSFCLCGGIDEVLVGSEVFRDVGVNRPSSATKLFHLIRGKYRLVEI